MKIGKAALTALVLFAFAVYYAMIMVFCRSLSAMVTMLGSVFFCWVYVESGYNLWCNA